MIEKVFSVDIAAPVQRVWDEITRRGSPQHALFGTYLHVDLRPGAVLTYRNKKGTHTFVLGEVLEVAAPRRFVHTFLFSMEKDDPTVVAWELAEHQGGTRLTVTHSRFQGETKTYKTVSTSWPKILGLFKRVIETGRAPVGKRMGNAMMAAMSFMLPKSSRTENATAMNLKAPAA